MNRARFELLVKKALDGLPDEFRRHIADVSVVVQDRPTRDQLARWAIEAEDEDLLGFYDGVPLTERSTLHDGVVSDVIYVFREPHLDVCDTDEDLCEEIRRTVVHEVAHHFGLDDDRIDELGYA